MSLPQYCGNAGYVTPTAFGMRLKGVLFYPDVLVTGLDLSPTVTYGWDISGWSYDNVISMGRQFAVLALRGEFNKTWFVEASYSPIWGGTFNTSRDRSAASLAFGAKF
jgi:hypothetical protein